MRSCVRLLWSDCERTTDQPSRSTHSASWRRSGHQVARGCGCSIRNTARTWHHPPSVFWLAQRPSFKRLSSVSGANPRPSHQRPAAEPCSSLWVDSYEVTQERVRCLYTCSGGALPAVKQADAPTCRVVILPSKANPMTSHMTYLAVSLHRRIGALPVARRVCSTVIGSIRSVSRLKSPLSCQASKGPSPPSSAYSRFI